MMILLGFGLIIAAVVLVFLEVWVPSGGLIGILATGVAIGGVALLFGESTTWGTIGLLVSFVLLPLAFVFAVQTLPNTPLGRHLVLAESDDDRLRREAEEREAAQKRAQLVGREGVAVTDLRPSGTVEVDGERWTAVAEVMLIDRGERVRVVRAESRQVRVRALPASGGGVRDEGSAGVPDAALRSGDADGASHPA